MHEPSREFNNVRVESASLRLRAPLGFAILLALACGFTGRSQSPSASSSIQDSAHPDPSPHQALSAVDPSELDPISQERRLRALNIERQKEIVSDANKLLKLAKELNDEVASAHAESLTTAQLHKIAEIEKLAHNVRERMTIGVGQPAGLEPTPMIPFPAGRGGVGP